MTIDATSKEADAFIEKVIELSNDYEKAKSNMFIKLTSHPREEELARLAFCDLYETISVRIVEEASFKVTNDLYLKKWDLIQVEQIFEDALENTKKVLPAKYMPMKDVLELFGGDMDDFDCPDFGMYVLSNEDFMWGASAILYAKDLLPDEFIMLPSSVHEVIVLELPNETLGELKKSEINDLIRYVNSTRVAIDMRLSNHAYYYLNDIWRDL